MFHSKTEMGNIYFEVLLNPDRCNNTRYVESNGSAGCSTLEMLQPIWTAGPRAIFI